jgi:rsbT co-antagonist protein RsbR
MAFWFSTFTERQEAIVEQTVTALQQGIPAYAALTRADVRARAHAALPPFARDLDADEPTHFSAYWEGISYQRAQQGLPISALLQVLHIGTKVMIAALKDAAGPDPAAQVTLIETAHAVAATGIAAIYAGYDRAHRDTIAAQEARLEEVATPILPIHAGILVLPLIGAIDSRRASQIMDSLLERISRQQASVVLMDITGVPVIDTGVANYLLQAARAARLLGASVVLVGISAEIAQTIVQLGIDLSDIATRGNLQDGMAFALGVQGLAIGPGSGAR